MISNKNHRSVPGPTVIREASFQQLIGSDADTHSQTLNGVWKTSVNIVGG